MIRKRTFIAFLSFLATFCLSSRQSHALTFTEFVYNNAKTNNIKVIQSFLSKGYNIDAIDSNGFTALCYAIEYKDFNAYKNLKALGANSNHSCTQKVSPKTSENYSKRYYPIQLDKTTKLASKNNSSLITTGAIVTGGAIALLASGSGGGSSKNNSTTQEPPQKNFDDDKEGWYENEEEQTPECPKGQAYINGECKSIQAPTGCKEGEKLVNGICEPIVCQDGYHLVGSSCLPDSGQSDNLEDLGGGYVSSGNIEIENETNDDIIGAYSNGSEIYNLYSVYARPDDYQKIKITNSGNGNVTALYSEGHTTNAFVDGMRSEDEINPKSPAKGIIQIQNYGQGTVAGIHSKVLDARNSFEASNSYSYDNGIAQGLIDIKNYGKGVTYGIYGDDRSYNAISVFSGKSYGDINIEANGDIYGINSYMAVMNATSHQIYIGHIAVANININSIGDGNVYGINVAKDVKIIEPEPGQNPIYQWFAINSAGAGGDIAKGNINIKNSGNGDVYGMHGGQQLHNGLFYGGRTATGLPTSRIFANINILNTGSGNVYGMYMPKEDINGIVSNLTEKGYYDEKIGQTGVTSTINLTNTGDGITTAMRGGNFNYIENSGTININNLGNGTAIGIYGGKWSRILNSGEINIYRKKYTDEETNQTYTPTSKKGGTAYGIYAQRGSTVKNTGTINITDASYGKGIYLEDGATLENSGTIKFNGQTQSGFFGEDLNIYNETDNENQNNTEPTSVVDFNQMGQGEVVLGANGKFFADTLKGNLAVSTSPTKGSFKDEYTLSNSLQANNIEDLTLKSKSAMFEASTSKTSDKDIVLTRKNFNNVVDNKQVADFLELNYQQENNVKLYDNLKEASNKTLLNKKVANNTGNDIIPSFRRENATIYRNLSREFNNNLFNKPNENYIAGYKYIDLSNDADNTLQESEGTAHVAYGLLKSKNNQGLTYGIGANITKLETKYDNNSKRDSNQFGLWLPLGYNFNNGLRMYSKLYAGYGDSSYDRITDFGTKTADYNEYQLGLSNEVRYAINLQNSLKLEPLLELNYLNYYQEDINESNATDSLKIKSDSASSLELGLGAYLTKELLFDNSQKLTIQIGGVYYVEFLEPDNALKATMNGMNGKLSIAHKQNNNRGVASLRASYNYKDISLYGNIEKDFGAIDAFSIDAGIQYKF